jgi:hypothetical protein
MHEEAIKSIINSTPYRFYVKTDEIIWKFRAFATVQMRLPLFYVAIQHKLVCYRRLGTPSRSRFFEELQIRKIAVDMPLL